SCLGGQNVYSAPSVQPGADVSVGGRVRTNNCHAWLYISGAGGRRRASRAASGRASGYSAGYIEQVSPDEAFPGFAIVCEIYIIPFQAIISGGITDDSDLGSLRQFADDG